MAATQVSNSAGNCSSFWRWITRLLAAAAVAVAPFAAPLRAAPLFDSFTGWSITPATEPDINETPAAGALRLRITRGVADEVQAYVTGALAVRSTGVNPAALSVDSNRTMTTQFVAKENARLHVNAFLDGMLSRTDQGMSQVVTSIQVTDATNAASILRIRAADDAGHWTHVRAANGDTMIDDTLFRAVDITAGHTYSIIASFQASAGTIPVNTAGTAIANFSVDPVTAMPNDFFFNTSFAVLPRAALTEWRGGSGVRSLLSQTNARFVPGLALSGAGVNVGMIEVGRPITDHVDMPPARLDIITAGHFPDALEDRFRDEHATAVAGIIVAGNGRGVAPGAHLYAAAIAANDRAETTTLDIRFDDAIEQLRAQGVTVVNVSAGFSGPNAQQANIAEKVNDAVKNRGIVFVSSAGNDGQFPGGGVTVAPAAAENAINVGAVDRSFFQAAYFSSARTPSGGPPHVVAPGEFIDTTLALPLNAARDRRDAAAPNDYGPFFYGLYRNGRGELTSGEITGTSFSSPMAAGVVALYQELAGTPGFAAVRADVTKPSAVRAAMMSAAWKNWFGTDMRYKDGTNYTTKATIVQRQGFDLYKEIGAGFMDSIRTLKLLNDRDPIVRNARAGGAPIPAAAALTSGVLSGAPLPQLPSDDPGADPLARMILADHVDAFLDTFAMFPYQQQEYAIPRPLRVGDTLGVTVSWNVGGAEFEAGRDLNLAIGLYKDNDLSDGIGSDEMISFGELSFDDEGVLLPAMLAGDVLTRTADGAWNSAEHLYFQVDDLSQEGYYYFRVFNLSPNADDFSIAGLIAPVPEPSTAALAALAVCGLFAVRRRSCLRREA